MAEKNQYVRQVAEQKYEFGFTTDVHTEIIEKGLNEDVVRLISAKKGEPEWMLDFRLKAFRYWKEQTEPKWGHVHVPPIDYQEISYYADPMAQKPKGDGKIDPELEKTFDKLGIPLEERLALSGNTAVDAIMDSVSVKTTFKEKLSEKGINCGVHYRDNTEYSIFAHGAGQAPKAHEISQHLITMPLHMWLTDEDVKTIIKEVNAAV